MHLQFFFTGNGKTKQGKREKKKGLHTHLNRRVPREFFGKGEGSMWNHD
jgi:hypothetical protein